MNGPNCEICPGCNKEIWTNDDGSIWESFCICDELEEDKGA